MEKQEFLFCVDSDGCAMDTMTYKHQLFFGPIAADVFQIEEREAFLQEWDRINLFSRTRGVNRFVGLVMGLEWAGVTSIKRLREWVQTTPSLSNASLEEAIAKEASKDLELAWTWSNEVNRQIKAYQGEALAFKGVKEGLADLQRLGKVVVVSSANREAVEEEWQAQGLLSHVDDLYCQDRGKKEDVIASFIADGYPPERILVIGDSPGDLAAAERNHVAFYPILVGKETQSWKELGGVAQRFIAEMLVSADLEDLQTIFWQNLDKE